MSFSSESLEFLVMLHQVNSGIFFSFSRCVEFSPEFLQIFVGPSDVIPLAVSEVHPHRELISLVFPYFLVSQLHCIFLLHMMKPLDR